MVLKGLEGSKRGTAGQKLVGELGLVAALVELVVVFLGVVWCEAVLVDRMSAGREAVSEQGGYRQSMFPKPEACVYLPKPNIVNGFVE